VLSWMLAPEGTGLTSNPLKKNPKERHIKGPSVEALEIRETDLGAGDQKRKGFSLYRKSKDWEPRDDRGRGRGPCTS